MATSFAAQVSAWARKSEARLQATRNRAIVLLGDEMTKTQPDGGRVPFKTGHLARSLVAATTEMPKVSETIPTGASVGTVAAMLPLSKAIWLGYSAIYARRVNSGYVGKDVLGRSFNQHGAYFVEHAAAKWQQLVTQAAKETQSEAEA